MRCHGFSANPRIQPTVLSPTDPWVPAENPSVWLNSGLLRGVGKERVTRDDAAVLGYKSRAVTPDSMRVTVPMVMYMTGISQWPTRSTVAMFTVTDRCRSRW